jgi:hypothetical protein
MPENSLLSSSKDCLQGGTLIVEKYMENMKLGYIWNERIK